MAGKPVTTSGGEPFRNGSKQQKSDQSRRRAVTADSATAQDQCHPRKIFIGGLAHTTSTQQLRDYFSHHGPIVDAVVLRWPDGRSRGFGYIMFQDASSASTALRTAHEVDGRQVDVKRAVPGTNKLFIGGLPQNTAAQELREHFEAFGVVSDAVVMIDPATNRSRGFGFVCFLPGQEGSEAVMAALEQYQNHRIRGKWIEVKGAAPSHKLVAKDLKIGTPPGLCDTPSSSEVGQVELSAIATPDSQVPMSSMQQQHTNQQQQKQQQHQEFPQKSKSSCGPKKVALPVTTTATMKAALAAMGSQPGQAVMGSQPGQAGPAKPKAGFNHSGGQRASIAAREQANSMQAGYPHPHRGDFPYADQTPWPPATTAAQTGPWPGSLTRASVLSVKADPFVPSYVSFEPNCRAAPELPCSVVNAWSGCDSTVGKSSLSKSLQEGLEQLFRQHSSRTEAETVDASVRQLYEPQCTSPCKVHCHGG